MPPTVTRASRWCPGTCLSCISLFLIMQLTDLIITNTESFRAKLLQLAGSKSGVARRTFLMQWSGGVGWGYLPHPHSHHLNSCSIIYNLQLNWISWYFPHYSRGNKMVIMVTWIQVDKVWGWGNNFIVILQMSMSSLTLCRLAQGNRSYKMWTIPVDGGFVWSRV